MRFHLNGTATFALSLLAAGACGQRESQEGHDPDAGTPVATDVRAGDDVPRRIDARAEGDTRPDGRGLKADAGADATSAERPDGPEGPGPAAGLDGFRWEIACGPLLNDWTCADYPTGTQSCPAGGTVFADKTVTFGGNRGTVYSVALRFRGMAEPNVYTGGVPEPDGFHTGGGGGGHRNIIAIHVSSPKQVFYLNSVPSTDGPHYALRIDYVKTIKISGGATVQLTGGDADCASDRNCAKDVDPCTPILIPDVPPFPKAWDGNFVQMDVVSVTPRP